MSEVTHLEALISCILWKVVHDWLWVCLHAQTMVMGLLVKWNSTHIHTQITNASLHNNCVSLPRYLLVSKKAFHSWQHTLWKHLFPKASHSPSGNYHLQKEGGSCICRGIWLHQQAYTPKSKMQKKYQKKQKKPPLQRLAHFQMLVTGMRLNLSDSLPPPNTFWLHSWLWNLGRGQPVVKPLASQK